MKKYMWQNPEFPNFTYNKELVLTKLNQVKLKQGYLLGLMKGIEFETNQSAVFNVLTEDVIKSSEIEGYKINQNQVRSSLAKKLGLDSIPQIPVERSVEGIVKMMFDATQNFNTRLSLKRLCDWHLSMFPDNLSGFTRINAGKLRDDRNGAMQVVSGAIGHEKIHYEAPPADRLKSDLKQLIDFINAKDDTDLIIKAAIVHLWFVILHPFEDGNGRIARALTDMLLSRSENSPNRYYSMSSQIKNVRKSYYEVLEITGQTSIDITSWLVWFLENLLRAIENSEKFLQKVYQKKEFQSKYQNTVFNKRQLKILNKLFDNFEGNLTTSKWAKICNCSQDTATRDISDLIKKGVLAKFGEGRATSYYLNL